MSEKYGLVKMFTVALSDEPYPTCREHDLYCLTATSAADALTRASEKLGKDTLFAAVKFEGEFWGPLGYFTGRAA